MVVDEKGEGAEKEGGTLPWGKVAEVESSLVEDEAIDT